MTSTRERQPSLVRMLRTCMRCDRRWSGARPPGGGHPRRPRSRRHAGASRRGRRDVEADVVQKEGLNAWICCRSTSTSAGPMPSSRKLSVKLRMKNTTPYPTKPTASSVISPAPARSTPDTAGSGRVAIEVGWPFPAPCCRGRLQARSSRTAEHAGKKLPYSVPRLEPRTPRVATRSPTACPPAPCTWDTPGTAAGPGPAGTGDAQVDVL